MDMLSTRLTGSSTSMISLSRRSAASTAVSAPGAPTCARGRTPGSGPRPGRTGRRRRRAICAWSRSKNALRVRARRPSSRPSAGQRRVPVVAGEHLVGALPGLHDPDRLADPLAEQVEGDDVVADHRLGHRADGVPERAGQLVGGRPGSGGGRCRSARRSRRSRRTRRPRARRRTRSRWSRSPGRSAPPARAGRRSGWSPGRRRAARRPGCRRPGAGGRRPAAPPRSRPPSRAPTRSRARDGARSVASQ